MSLLHLYTNESYIFLLNNFLIAFFNPIITGRVILTKTLTGSFVNMKYALTKSVVYYAPKRCL